MSENRPKILVIDDEQSILDVIQMLLESEPRFEVRTTTDVQQWREILNEFQPDLILVDHRMPAMTGAEFIRVLKLSGLGSKVKAVGLFSATPFSEADVQRMGADFFFEKPFDVTTLLGLLRRYAGVATV